MDLETLITILLTVGAVLICQYWYRRLHPSPFQKQGSTGSRALCEKNREKGTKPFGVISPYLEEFIRMFPDTKRTVQNTIATVDSVETARTEFDVEYYDLWTIQRQTTIRKLGELIENLDTVSKYVHGSKVAGSTTSILGSIGVIVTKYVPFLSDYLNIASNVRLIGNVVVPASDFLQNWISDDYINDVKTEVKKDLKLTDRLRHPVVQARKLQENFSFLFDCSFQSSSEELENAVTNRVEIHNTVARAIEYGLGVREEYGDTLQMICEMRDIYGTLLQKIRDPRVFRMCKSTVEIAMIMHGLDFINLNKNICLPVLSDVMPPDCDNLAVLCLREAPNIMQHCVSLNSSIKIALEGKSEYHTPLTGLIEILSKELEVIEANISGS